MSAVNLGKIDELLFYGGGKLMLDCALEAKAQGIPITVIAAPRHIQEEFCHDNLAMTLSSHLKRLSILFYETEDINSLPELKKLAHGNILGLGFGETYTFSKDTIELFNNKLFDLMVIRLPQYRGGAHFTWQILRSSKLAAWNIQQIDERMIPGEKDTGLIYLNKNYILPSSARIPADYFHEAEKEGLLIFKDFISKIQNNHNFTPYPLDEGFSAFYPRLYTDIHGWIDWSWTADEIERFICAFDEPYKGASSMLGETRVHLKEAVSLPDEGVSHPFMSGLVYRKDERGIFVWCRDAAILIKKITDDEGNDASNLVKLGERFFTSKSILENAINYRAVYDAKGLR